MEQGPEELSDTPDERGDQLERLTGQPLDSEAGDDKTSEEERDEDLDRIDPGL